ncbi:replicative DNA helicase, partial [Salmonella enterica]|uniref:replicative DNA helicase n=1 Tax=Salmonella enterica TaxID=28901 RepID=UPI003F9FDA0A
MTARTDSRFDEVSEVSRKLKAMAKNTGCPVLALSQLNRSVEKRNPPIPNNSDLRESGQIEQDADIISFIYREEVYEPDTFDKGIAEVITTKFRNGEVGTDYLAAKLQFSRFEDLHFEYV